MRKLFFILLFSGLVPGILFSQSIADSTILEDNAQTKDAKTRKHPPRTAMLFSLILPGAGQVYNKKYWKVPLIYASMGTTLYFFKQNDKLYKDYHLAYLYKTDGKDSTIDVYPDYTDAQLHELEDYHRKYRDLNVILTALFYTINVLDAYVDAHLMRFDVSDDLSLHVLPSFQYSTLSRRPRAGITLALTF